MAGWLGCCTSTCEEVALDVGYVVFDTKTRDVCALDVHPIPLLGSTVAGRLGCCTSTCEEVTLDVRSEFTQWVLHGQGQLLKLLPQHGSRAFRRIDLGIATDLSLGKYPARLPQQTLFPPW